ncbi:MAG TPA: DNA primase [Ktedonobacterales bacterium]|nr:DNA primase [Ktedonobacterales bacterium]
MATEATSVIERIKQKLDIVEEIGAVVSLKKSGKAYKGLCPFHGERTPSFYVFPDKQDWHCFGCGERGDLITFVQKQQSLDFREALELLAERAGIPLERADHPETAEEAAETSARKRLRALNEAAAIWFHHQLLQSTAAQYCRSYLDSRGVSNESIAHWRLGYAPDGDGLVQYLLSVGYSAKELVEAGLAREREAGRGGGMYAYFRNRLIFPIRDARGQTVAFGGRTLDGAQPKYLNTPQTLLFDKSATLYGLDLARDSIRRTNRVVIVEGYMDAVVTHQYGTRNVVACIGSAITEKHIRQIKKLTRRVTLALDPDAAGESATLRGITVAQQAFDRMVVPVPGPAPEHTRSQQGGWATHGKRGSPRGIVRFEEQVDAEMTVAMLPPDEDPDEYARRDPAGWQRAIEASVPLIDYMIEAQTSDLALDTPQGKLEASRRLLPILAEVRDRTLAGEYADRLAAHLHLDVRDVQRDLAQTRRRLDREARSQTRGQVDSGIAESEITGEPLGTKYPEMVGSPAGPFFNYRVSGAAGATGELLAELAQAEYCIGLLVASPATWMDIYAILDEHDFTSADMRAIYAIFAAATRDGKLGQLAQAALGLPDSEFITLLPEELRQIAENAGARVALNLPESGPTLTKIASKAAYRLKRMRLKAEMAELDYLVRESAGAGDHEGLRTLMARKKLLLTQRRAIDTATDIWG